MNFSLNEVDATARKAARGAGYGWGLSEEAGKATRWLCAHGLDGCRVLAGALVRPEDCKAAGPVALSGEWYASDGELCPLSTGACLSDCADRLTGTSLRMRAVRAPALLLPFAAMAARELNQDLSLTWTGVRASTDGATLRLEGDPLQSGPADVTLQPGLHSVAPCVPVSRCTPRPEDWATLNALAARTYAPATEESRLLGAGAGVTDND
jgi:hypothetical protein